MSWNYRVVLAETEHGTTWGLHEVYYDEAGRPIACTADPVEFSSDEGHEDLILSMQTALRDAMNRPVLLESEIGTKDG